MLLEGLERFQFIVPLPDPKTTFFCSYQAVGVFHILFGSSTPSLNKGTVFALDKLIGAAKDPCVKVATS